MSESPREQRRSISLRTLGTLVLALLALVFIFQNTASKQITFLFWSFSMPAWIWLLLVFVVGVAAGWLLPRVRHRRRS